MRKNISGFTVAELIIVIVVIAILAAITIVAYNGFQTRAKAADIETNIKDVEKSLRVYAAEQKWQTWPKEWLIIPNPGSPSIQTLIDQMPGFADYLPRSAYASTWSYDSDGDSKSDCGLWANGTNIIIPNITQALAEQIDADIDDGSTDCGRVRYNGTTSISYALSYSDDLSL